jgi:hypothetical protein
LSFRYFFTKIALNSRLGINKRHSWTGIWSMFTTAPFRIINSPVERHHGTKNVHGRPKIKNILEIF